MLVTLEEPNQKPAMEDPDEPDTDDIPDPPAFQHVAMDPGLYCLEMASTSRSAWDRGLRHGCLNKTMNQALVMYSHLTALSARKLEPLRFEKQFPNRATSSTSSASDGDAFLPLRPVTETDNEDFDPRVGDSLPGPELSPVLREDFSRPPPAVEDTPPIMFSTEEFLQYLVSGDWGGKVSLRVIGGDLLQTLLHSLYRLERQRMLNTHVLRANLNSRQRDGGHLGPASHRPQTARPGQVDNPWRWAEAWTGPAIEGSVLARPALTAGHIWPRTRTAGSASSKFRSTDSAARAPVHAGTTAKSSHQKHRQFCGMQFLNTILQAEDKTNNNNIHQGRQATTGAEVEDSPIKDRKEKWKYETLVVQLVIYEKPDLSNIPYVLAERAPGRRAQSSPRYVPQPCSILPQPQALRRYDVSRLRLPASERTYIPDAASVGHMAGTDDWTGQRSGLQSGQISLRAGKGDLVDSAPSAVPSVEMIAEEPYLVVSAPKAHSFDMGTPGQTAKTSLKQQAQSLDTRLQTKKMSAGEKGQTKKKVSTELKASSPKVNQGHTVSSSKKAQGEAAKAAQRLSRDVEFEREKHVPLQADISREMSKMNTSPPMSGNQGSFTDLQRLNLTRNELYVTSHYLPRTGNRFPVSDHLRRDKAQRLKCRAEKEQSILQSARERASCNLNERFKCLMLTDQAGPRQRLASVRMSRAKGRPAVRESSHQQEWDQLMAQQEEIDRDTALDRPQERNMLKRVRSAKPPAMTNRAFDPPDGASLGSRLNRTANAPTDNASRTTAVDVNTNAVDGSSDSQSGRVDINAWYTEIRDNRAPTDLPRRTFFDPFTVLDVSPSTPRSGSTGSNKPNIAAMAREKARIELTPTFLKMLSGRPKLQGPGPEYRPAMDRQQRLMHTLYGSDYDTISSLEDSLWLTPVGEERDPRQFVPRPKMPGKQQKRRKHWKSATGNTEDSSGLPDDAAPGQTEVDHKRQKRKRKEIQKKHDYPGEMAEVGRDLAEELSEAADELPAGRRRDMKIHASIRGRISELREKMPLPSLASLHKRLSTKPSMTTSGREEQNLQTLLSGALEGNLTEADRLRLYKLLDHSLVGKLSQSGKKHLYKLIDQMAKGEKDSPHKLLVDAVSGKLAAGDRDKLYRWLAEAVKGRLSDDRQRKLYGFLDLALRAKLSEGEMVQVYSWLAEELLDHDVTSDNETIFYLLTGGLDRLGLGGESSTGPQHSYFKSPTEGEISELLISLVDFVMIRKETLSSSLGHTYITLTFTRPGQTEGQAVASPGDH